MTDANLLLGRLAADEELPGGLRLDRDAAAAAIGRLAGELSLEPLRAAEGIVALADQEMAKAVRRMTVERGMDPRGLALIPFGGAGPMHAAGIASLLGITRIACPRAGGVLSALGLCASEQRRDAARTVLIGGADLTGERLADLIEALVATIETEPGDRIEVSCAMRYRGQGFELDVAADRRPRPEELRRDFERVHREHYGFTDPDAEIELVTIRVAAITPAESVLGTTAAGNASWAPDRPVFFAGEWLCSAVLRGAPDPGQEVAGPLIIEMDESTLVLPPGWRGSVDADGTIVTDFDPADR